MPRRIWHVMTPELPRAPMSAPKLAACATRSASASARPVGLLERRPDGGQHVRPGVAVRDREHVERVDLVDVRLERRDGAPEAARKPAPSHERRGIRRRPSRSRRGRTGRGRRGRVPPAGRDAVLAAEPADADRQPVGLAAERRQQRVAHRALDLAGDLGDRQAIGDRQVEVDRELSPARRGCPDGPGRRRSRSRPIGPPPANPETPYDREVAGADEVADGARRDEGPAGDGISGHAGDVLRAGAGRCSAGRGGHRRSRRRAVLRYHPVRAGPRPTRA